MYLTSRLRLYDAWHTGGLIGLGRDFLAALGFRAPLITALPLPFYWIFGRRWHMAFLVNIVAMLVLFISVYKIGQRLRSSWTGLVAVYITGTLPLLYGLARLYLVEYTMTAMVAAAYWLALVVAEEMSITAALALGVVCGMGLLLKVAFPVFVLPALVYTVWRRAGTRLQVVLSILLPCMALAAPWYWHHWRATLDYAAAAGYGASAVVQGTGPIFAAKTIWAYLGLVMERGVSLYYVLVAVAASITLVLQRRWKASRRAYFLALWFAPFLVFLFGGNKDVRHIAPILPAFALAIACLMDVATRPHRWATIAVLIFPFLSLLAISFGWPYDARDAGYAHRYDANTWGQDAILNVISDDFLYRYGEQKMVLLATDRGRFNADNFQLAVAQRQLPLRVETTAYDSSVDGVLQHANVSAYVVYKEGGEPESPFFNKYYSQLLLALRQSQDWVELPFSVSIPDGGTARIFRHQQTRR